MQSEKNINNASADECIYLGNTGDGNNNDAVGYQGKRMLTMEGGEIASIAGGVNAYGANYTNYMVNNGNAVIVRIKGGTVRGSIYGAAAFAGASGDRQYIITGGTIRSWIAGGCNGTKTDGGKMYGSTHIYFGGDAQCNSNNNTAINSSLGGNIFGAGSGIEGGTTVGQVYHSEVVIADNCMVERDVYGGGNYGYVNAGTGHGSDIYILGGTVGGKVFGGSNQQQGQQVEIQMTGGTVIGGVYGGSNSSGAVSGPVKENILGGTVGEDGQDNDHGNGFGVGTSVTGDVYVIIGDSTALTTGHTTQPFIWDHVFGGGHETNYNATGHEFKVLGYNSTVNKNVFGGGMDGEVRGNSFVIIKD